MAERLTTEQRQLITAYRQQFAELRTYSDEQILSIINNAASDISLSEDERVSILSNNLQGLNLGGLTLESQPIELSQDEEAQLLSLLQARSEAVTSKTEDAESKNGFLGKAWSWTKNNLLDWCTDSTNDIKKAQAEEQEALKNGNVKEAFEKITGLEYTKENLTKFLNNEVKTKSETAVEAYSEGQEMAADFAGDMVSGILSVGIYMGAVAGAPFTGGASIAVGLAAATASAGLIKSGLKYADAKSAGQEYNTFKKDFITGSFSGLLAPITGGIGGAVGRNVAARLGVQAVKQVGKEAVEQTGKQTLKTMLTNPVGYEYVGKRWALALGSEMAADGALGGSIDNTFRTAYEMNEKGEEITASTLLGSFMQGGLGGLFMAPAIGGGLKGMGKLSGQLVGKNMDAAAEARLTSMVRELDEPQEVWVPKKTNKTKTTEEVSTLKFADEPRFKPEEVDEIFNKIENSALKDENPELIRNTINMLGNLTDEGVRGERPRFQDYEIRDIISALDSDNIEFLGTLISAKDKYGYTVHPYIISDILKTLSGHDINYTRKLVNMFKADPANLAYAGYIERSLKVLDKYPDEFAILTNDFDSSLINHRVFTDIEELTGLLDTIRNSSPEKKKFLSYLIPDKNVDNKTIELILSSDIDINEKQLLTLLQTAYYSSGGAEKYVKILEQVKGKEIDVSFDNIYTKQDALTLKEKFDFVQKLGLSEEDCKIFSEHEYADLIIRFIHFSEEMNLSVFGGAPKKESVQQMIQIFKTGNKDALKEFEEIAPIAGYFTKENYEVFAAKNGETDVESFFEHLSLNTANVESRYACLSIAKQTGRKVYEQDTLLLGSDAIKLHNLRDADIATGIRVLKELGLYSDDANLVTLLSRSKELCDIKVTPEIKEFAEYLSKDKFMEEGAMIELLHSVQANSSEMIQSKINFAKEMLQMKDISSKNIAEVMDRVSVDNPQILNKQLSVLYNERKNSSYMILISKFLNTKNVDEFNTYIKYYESIRAAKEDYTAYSSLYHLISPLNAPMKSELTSFANKLADKGIEFKKINDIFSMLTHKHRDIMAEYISLYSKGLDMDLGPVKDIYDDIILLQLSDIKSLNIRERLQLYEKLNSLGDDAKSVLSKLGLDYDHLYNKVMDSLSAKRPLVSLPAKQSQLLMKNIIANNNSRAEKVLKEFDFAQFGKQGLPLRYSRADFNTKVESLLQDLSEDEVQLILKHFGLERGEAGFDGLPNNRVFENTKVSEQARVAAAKIQKEIENFTVNNEVMIANPEIKEVLDGLVRGMPEFTSIVGKQQHGTHAYSVDIHTLKVLQSAMNNPLYQTLSDLDKTILKYSIILHDLGKKGGVVDQGHAGLSADYTASILERYSFQTSVKDRVIDIVDNHHWFEKYNTGACTAENVAVRCRKPEDLKIYEIFSKADFENVNETFHLGNKSGGSKTQAEFDIYMRNKMVAVEEAVNKIYQKANYVFDTQFMHNGRQFPTRQIEIDGQTETLHVLNLSELADGEDLMQYGFAPGVTKENARFFVHMTEPNNTALETVLRLTETPVFQSTWSTSFIKESNNRTYAYRKFGLIFDTPQANISEAFFANSGSGTEKGIDAFKKFLFGSRTMKWGNETYDVRHYVKNNFIKEMEAKGYDLDDVEYAALSQYLFNKQYTSQIRKDIQVGNSVIKAKDLVEALEKSRDALFEGGDIHSEIIPINPKVKGLVAKVEKLEDCPPEFLKFAKEHNLPIILMKATDGR